MGLLKPRCSLFALVMLGFPGFAFAADVRIYECPADSAVQKMADHFSVRNGSRFQIEAPGKQYIYFDVSQHEECSVKVSIETSGQGMLNWAITETGNALGYCDVSECMRRQRIARAQAAERERAEQELAAQQRAKEEAVRAEQQKMAQEVEAQNQAVKQLMSDLPRACSFHDSNNPGQVVGQAIPKVETPFLAKITGVEAVLGIVELRTRFSSVSCIVAPPPTSTRGSLVLTVTDGFPPVDCEGSFELTHSRGNITAFSIGECTPTERIIPQWELYASPKAICENDCDTAMRWCRNDGEVPDALCQNNYYHCKNACN